MTVRPHQIKVHDFGYINDPDKVVSVIIPFHERRETIFRVIERLMSQRLTLCGADDVEIIVIDDGSAQPSIANDLPEKVIYLWQRRLGHDGYMFGASRARNTGARIANGGILVFVDADILVREDHIDTVLGSIREHGPLVAQVGYIWDYSFPGSPDPRTPFGVWENPGVCRRFYQLASGNFAVSRQLFDAAGGFDEDLIYGGVEDICFGYQIGCVPGSAMNFNPSMEGWHLPHPPSVAHANTERSWEIARRKHPDFYDAYYARSIR